MYSFKTLLAIGFTGAMLAGAVPPRAAAEPPQASGASRSSVEPTAAQALSLLNEKLSLSSEQKSAVLALLEKLQTELSTLKDSGGSPRAMPEERLTFISTTAGQVRALLTPNQQSLFDAIRPDHRAQIFGQ